MRCHARVGNRVSIGFGFERSTARANGRPYWRIGCPPEPRRLLSPPPAVFFLKYTDWVGLNLIPLFRLPFFHEAQLCMPLLCASCALRTPTSTYFIWVYDNRCFPSLGAPLRVPFSPVMPQSRLAAFQGVWHLEGRWGGGGPQRLRPSAERVRGAPQAVNYCAPEGPPSPLGRMAPFFRINAPYVGVIFDHEVPCLIVFACCSPKLSPRSSPRC